MRVAIALVLTLSAALGTQTAEKIKTPSRYGFDLSTKNYPQQTPKETLGSVLKAIGENQIGYLLAHLTDPAFVDQRVAVNAGKMDSKWSEREKEALAFGQLVQSTSEAFKKDPSKLADLQRFQKDGEWQEDGNDAVATLKGLQVRKVFMKKAFPDRWVLLDREK
jgi:hypothetical protein